MTVKNQLLLLDLGSFLKWVQVHKMESLVQVMVRKLWWKQRFISGKKSNQMWPNQIKSNIMVKQIGCNRPLQILASLYLQRYIFSLLLMVDYGKKWCHFCFKVICGPKVNNWGTVFDFICKNVVHQRAVVQFIYFINLTQVYQDNFGLRWYWR